MMTLYVNTWQAMPGSGDLNLETQNTKLDKDFSIDIYLPAPDKRVSGEKKSSGEII